jgi:hypothetical protein
MLVKVADGVIKGPAPETTSRIAQFHVQSHVRSVSNLMVVGFIQPQLNLHKS